MQSLVKTYFLLTFEKHLDQLQQSNGERKWELPNTKCQMGNRKCEMGNAIVITTF